LFPGAGQFVCEGGWNSGGHARRAGVLSVFAFATFAAFGYVRARTLLIAIVGTMFLSTLWFLYVQAFVLHAYCRYCLFSAAITFRLACLVIAVPSSQEQ
jgi:uncharacterized membrane protein